MLTARIVKNFSNANKLLFKKPNRMWLFVLPVTGIGVGSRIYNDAQFHPAHWKSTLTGVYRLGNLVSTVVMIAGDYAYTKYRCREDDAEIDSVRSELKRAREEHEQISLRRHKSTDGAELLELNRELKVSTTRLRALSDMLLELEEKYDEPGSAYRQAHHRSALKLHKLCELNGGVYVKLGQHLAQLDYLFPMEFIVVLRRLLGDTPRSPYSSVRSTVMEDFGQYPEEIWAEFDPTPIASASLAQVHVARDRDGKKLAVKVQHRHLLTTAAHDMRAVTLMVNLVAAVFKEFSYTWLAREMNTNLPMELNFNQEAANIEKCRTLLSPLIRSGELALPEVHRSSERVLVMSFEEGWYITDEEKMAASGVDKSEVARLISKTFCEQIYRHGFVHCDPHAANVLVRTRPGSSRKHPKAQIVLLDHGLYRQLDDKFRMDYCRLWRGIVTSNVTDIEKHCRAMNAGDMYPLLSAMLTLRAWDDIVSRDMTKLQSVRNKADAERIRFYAQRYMKQIVSLMEHVPSSMLLLLKTNDCLRQLDKSVGTPINTMTVVAETAADVILHEELKNSSSAAMMSNAYWRYIELESRVVLLRVVGTWLQLVNRVGGLWSNMWGDQVTTSSRPSSNTSTRKCASA